MLHSTVLPPPPGPLTVTFSPESSLTISWSPPSGPVEGGVGGYVFGVTGEGCGCVSLYIGGDTTNVTCSGWTADGQTCSFEVRTLSLDSWLTSEPVTKSVLLSSKLCHSLFVFFKFKYPCSTIGTHVSLSETSV